VFARGRERDRVCVCDRDRQCVCGGGEKYKWVCACVTERDISEFVYVCDRKR